MHSVGSHGITYATDDVIYFYCSPFDYFNNWSAHSVDIWGHTFATAEHAYHWKKFELTEPQLALAIKNAGSPGLAKDLSRTSENLRPDWYQRRTEFMVDIVRRKVAQHAEVREALLASVGKKIVENSADDPFWGCGETYDGQNQLGQILMQIREEIALRPAC